MRGLQDLLWIMGTISISTMHAYTSRGSQEPIKGSASQSGGPDGPTSVFGFVRSRVWGLLQPSNVSKAGA